jgi:5-dehydro-4-deoxyglucarate dehydratase
LGRSRVTIAPELLKWRISEGILAFPATAFGVDGGLDRATFSRHISDLVRFRPSAVAAAGGAGEIFSLAPAEHRELIEAAVARSGDVPVLAGAGQGVAVAVEMARVAEQASAAGVLIFPPYLITAEQDGLAAYIKRVCDAVSIGVVAYSRDNGVIATETALRLAETCPNLIAIKDGTGNFEALVTLKQRAGDRLTLINGVPTAEIIARQCFALDMRSYTSAVFTFLPQVATRFYRALAAGEDAMIDRLLRDFYAPLTAIRRRRRGYAVAIVKAGLKLTGRPAGPVRPPLVELTPEDERELAALIARGSAIVAEEAVGTKAVG